jgi:hypothetical protein
VSDLCQVCALDCWSSVLTFIHLPQGTGSSDNDR